MLATRNQLPRMAYGVVETRCYLRQPRHSAGLDQIWPAGGSARGQSLGVQVADRIGGFGEFLGWAGESEPGEPGRSLGINFSPHRRD